MINNKYEAYTLGFFYADGYIYNKGVNNNMRIEIKEEDGQHLHHIFNHLIEWNVYSRQREHWKPTITFHKGNKALCKQLCDWNYKSKLNFNLDHICTKYLRYWLLGFLDGDGSMYLHPKQYLRQITFSGPYDMDWQFLTNILTINAIGHKHSTQINSANSRSSKIRITNRLSITNFGQCVYPNGFEFGLKRKYDKYVEMMQTYKS